jgi:hypothetical protein
MPAPARRRNADVRTEILHGTSVRESGTGPATRQGDPEKSHDQAFLDDWIINKDYFNPFVLNELQYFVCRRCSAEIHGDATGISFFRLWFRIP